MWQLLICATLNCSEPVDTGQRLPLEECRVTAALMVKGKLNHRGVCRSEDGRAWATDWGWKPLLKVM